MPTADTGVVIDRDVWVAMRDGVRLQADVWRPAGAGRFPALLQRTPYNRADSFAVVVNAGIEPLRAVEQGFVVVVQDTRGRFGSEGVFEPFVHEAADGYDTIEWLAAQPYCDGHVGMYGASYYAATQLLAATARPPALKAIAPKATASDYHDQWIYQGGALQLGFAMYWALGLAAAEIDRRQGAGEDLRAIRSDLQRLLADPWSAFAQRPLGDVEALRELLPAWQDWLDHPSRDDYWRAISISEHHQELEVPALHIGGWFDLFLPGTLAGYEGMLRGRNRHQNLIVGPWAHAVEYDALGEVDFGGAAAAAALDMTSVHLDWFSRFLKPGAARVEAAPVRVFVMGANAWRGETEWPPARAVTDRLYLGGTQTADGFAGTLRHQLPDAGTASTTFLFDPANPVPTVGGATFLPGAYVGLHAGPRDQRAVESRADVVCYDSETFTQDFEIAGPVAVVLHAATSAADTDWTAKLVDVHPDGRALNICDGIIRARYREGTSLHSGEPGQPHSYRIDLGATCIVIFAGHALRLEVSSSNFPRFDVNPNHGGIIATADKDDLVVAQQTILHGRAHPSCLELYVIPAPDPGTPQMPTRTPTAFAI